MGLTGERAGAGLSRPVRRLWLLAGAAVTVLLIGATGSFLWGRMAATASVGPAQVQVQTQAYTGQPQALVIQLASGDVTLRRGPAGRITVRRRLQWSVSKPVVHEHWDGQVLNVRQDCPAGPFNRNCDTDYTLTVPPGVTVGAFTGSGTIVVAGITGQLNLMAGSGDITASGAAGQVQAQTGSGNVTVTGARSAQVMASSDSGDVALAFASEPRLVRAHSASGNVTVLVPSGASYNVQAGTASGNRTITVGQDSTAPRSIAADSDSGDVTVAYR